MQDVIASLERDSQSKILRLSVKISLRFFPFFFVFHSESSVCHSYVCWCVLLFILNRCYSRLIGSGTLNARCHRQFRARQSIKNTPTFSQNFFTFFSVFFRFSFWIKRLSQLCLLMCITFYFESLLQQINRQWNLKCKMSSQV